MTIDTSKMLAESEFDSSEDMNPGVLHDLAREAVAFLEHHKWCRKVEQIWFDRGFEKIAVFFCHLDAVNADPALFVIVGDICPAYIDCVQQSNGAEALDGYAGALENWANLAESGQSLEDAMPVLTRGGFDPIPPTPENISLVRSRIKFIDEQLLPLWKDELGENGTW